MNNNDLIEKITTYYGYTYIIPCVCTFGIICNIVNLSVLASRRLKESPYTYLTALAWFDLLTLLFTLTTTFSRGAWSQKSSNVHTEFLLKRLERILFLPSANLFSALSISVTVVLTIERYLFIKFPMHASSFCTPSNARRIVCVLIALVFAFRLPMYFFSDAELKPIPSMVINSTTDYNFTAQSAAIIITTTVPNLYTHSTNSKFRVSFIKKYEQYHKPYFLTSFLLFEIVPFIILFTFNLNLVLLIKSSTKELESMERDKTHLRKNQTNHTNLSLPLPNSFRTQHSCELSVEPEKRSMLSRVDSTNSNRSPRPTTSLTTINSFKNRNTVDNKIEKRKRDQYKLTRTLITVVFFVLLSEISSIATYDKLAEFLVKFIFNSDNYTKSTYYKLQVFISNLIVLVVHSVNFFLYCAFNQKYLMIFKETYSCLCNFLGKLSFKKHPNLPNRAHVV